MFTAHSQVKTPIIIASLKKKSPIINTIDLVAGHGFYRSTILSGFQTAAKTYYNTFYIW